MVDKSIVTFVDNSDDIIGDFEVPVKISVKDLSVKIISLLKAMNSEKYSGIYEIKFEHKNKVVSEDSTFYQNGIWDGSIVKILY